MSSPVCVLVTGVSGGSIGEQVVKTLRSGTRDYTIVAANTTPGPMAVVEADHYELLPAADSDSYLDAILSLTARHGIQFVVPGSEAELRRLSRERGAFTGAGVSLLINSGPVIETCLDKSRTFAFLIEHGFRIPETLDATAVDGPKTSSLRFPYIVKPATGGGGSASAFLAQDVDELRFFVGYLLRCGRQPLIQQYVGTAEDEYTVGVLNFPDGRVAGTVVLHRSILSGLSNRLRVPNRTGRSELGSILAISSGVSQGRIIRHSGIEAQAEAIARSLASTGPLNIQGRWDGRDFVPFEINPRFSGTTPMRALAGFNEPELLINWHLKSDAAGSVSLRTGLLVRGLSEHFVEEDT